MPPIHTAAATGFAAAAETYAAGRPDYPEAVGGWLTGALGLAPGRRVLDLGAGTGKFTARLVATGAEVLAVEPVAEMRARLAADLPGVTALPGTAEAIPLPDASLDAVTCAQAFHWFATPEALAEMARVLRPGGRLGLVWNLRDQSEPWVAALTALMEPHEGDAPRVHHGTWRQLFPTPAFGPLDTVTFPHAHTGPFAQVVEARVMSVSFIAALPEAARAAFGAQLNALADRFPALAGRGVVRFPYRTECHALTRR